MRYTSTLTMCLFLSASSNLAAQLKASTDPAHTIRMWRVGSPHNENTPDTVVPLDVKLRARGLGLSIEVEAYPAKGFAQRFFDAVEAHQQPDLLVVDNYGIVDGITTKLGQFTGIASDHAIRQSLINVEGTLRGLTGGRGGWQFLIATSRNYSATRTLTLTPVSCETGSAPNNAPSDLLATANELTRQYLESPELLKAAEDRSFLATDSKLADSIQVKNTQLCGYAGNAHLAFISMAATFESARSLGQRQALLVLRRQDPSWRLLSISSDPITNSGLAQQLPAISRMLQGSWTSSLEPAPAQLVSPDGTVPKPPVEERFGNFTWNRTSSDNVAFEIVEFAYDGDARLFLRLAGKESNPESISSGQLWTTGRRWKWRVWSISDAGRIAFSPEHSFVH